ncbi:MAG TPA: hypothetical protein VIR57_23000, partial [Chloroflexota bacterium]
LRQHGPTPYAFTFRAWFPPPSGDSPPQVVNDDRWLWPGLTSIQLSHGRSSATKHPARRLNPRRMTWRRLLAA